MKELIFKCGFVAAMLTASTSFAYSPLDNLNNLFNSDKFYIKYKITRDNAPNFKPSPYYKSSYRGQTEGFEVIIAKSGKNLLVTFEDDSQGSIGDFFRELKNSNQKIRFLSTTIINDGDAAQFIFDTKDNKYKSHISLHRGMPGYEACELKDVFDLHYGDFYSRVLNKYPGSEFTLKTIKRIGIPQSDCTSLFGNGEEELNGEIYSTEIYVTDGGRIPETRKYYYKNGQLAMIVTTDGPSRAGTTMNSVGHNATLSIMECKNDFDESIFEIPKDIKIIESLHWRNKILKQQNKK